MRINPKIIQLVGDALIPLLGFFWWNWSLYFIIVFYLIDYLSNEIILHFKSKKIVQFQQKPKSIWQKKGLYSGILWIICIIIIHLAIRSMTPNIHFSQELIKFWTYKDLGIEQGYILVPLIALVGFQRYKLEFIATSKFKTMELEMVWKKHIAAHYIIIAFSALIIGVSSFFVFPDVVYLFGIILFSTAYQFLYKD